MRIKQTNEKSKKQIVTNESTETNNMNNSNVRLKRNIMKNSSRTENNVERRRSREWLHHLIAPGIHGLEILKILNSVLFHVLSSL